MTVPLSRRRALAGLALGVPALVLATACSASEASEASEASAGGPDVRLHTDWTARPDGSAPDLGDDGVPFRVVRDGAGSAPSVVAGALVPALPDRLSSSSIAQEMRARVRRIGASFTFGPGSAQGALTLAAWTAVPFVNAHCHLVLTPAQWLLGVVEEGTLRVVTQGTFRTPLPQGPTPSSVDVTVAGDTATVRLPDGGSTVARDPRFATTLGTVPCWGFYKTAPGGTDARLLRSWAG
ncbi:hypothetical protein [Actinomycetospora sp. NBRC 106378]|uniref:hypothetical protein n=1 Tax=Actinomycetospora sp. NBRC 106378 TaxID=3032208 RepID=UPI0024A54B30|nr:hypothetical protein [Actinomycetospora sp. NBRC 106378]GLZ51858.1 hypothetical protein Acsp07_14750 [Actinomycetospora sp. NBRC 106378]